MERKKPQRINRSKSAALAQDKTRIIGLKTDVCVFVGGGVCLPSQSLSDTQSVKKTPKPLNTRLSNFGSSRKRVKMLAAVALILPSPRSLSFRSPSALGLPLRINRVCQVKSNQRSHPSCGDIGGCSEPSDPAKPPQNGVGKKKQLHPHPSHPIPAAAEVFGSVYCRLNE